MPLNGAQSCCGDGRYRDQGETSDLTTADQTLQHPSTKNKQREQELIRSLSIAPLILEGAKAMTKVKSNRILERQFAAVKVLDIQVDRSGTFTIYTGDIISFNNLLNDLSSYRNENESQ
jgi:hypothetical protein